MVNLDFVRYILEEYSYIGSARRHFKVNPRLLIFDREFENDESFTLRLAAHSSDAVLAYLWDNYGYLFNERHLEDVTKFLVHRQKYESLNHLLKSETTSILFRNSPLTFRSRYIGLMGESVPVESKNYLQQYPYNLLDKQVEEDKLG